MKKILEVNPDLGVPEIIALVRQSVKIRQDLAIDAAAAVEVIDEARALQLARETLVAKGRAAAMSASIAEMSTVGK